jgi:hypothetical protein
LEKFITPTTYLVSFKGVVWPGHAAGRGENKFIEDYDGENLLEILGITRFLDSVHSPVF